MDITARILGLLICITFVTGQYTLLGSDKYGTTGMDFTFICTTSPVQSTIQWDETYTNSGGGRNTSDYEYVYNDGRCQRSAGYPPSDYRFDCDSSGVFTLTFTVNYTRHERSNWTCGNAFALSDSITLDVRVPLTSVTLLNATSFPLNVTEDGFVSLVCETNPTELVSTITWRKDSQTVSQDVTTSSRSETQGIVAVSVWSKSVKWGDRGNYSCQAYNSGVTRSSHTLSMIVQVPVYLVHLTNTTIFNQEISLGEGAQLVLLCRTSFSYPASTVRWYIDDIETSSEVVSHIEIQPSGQVITISTISRTLWRSDDTHQIYCKAENGFEVRKSWPARFNVYYGPGAGEVQVIKSSTAIEHDPVTLTCRTTNNVKPNVTITWTLDGSVVTSGMGIKLGSSESTWSQNLTLTPTRNQRTVGCTVSNSLISRQDSSSVDLDVNYPPDISLKPLEGPETADLTLKCTATGNPSIYQFEDFTQYWGNQLIQRRAGSQSGDRYDLTLARVTYQDSGVYVCTVGNNVKQPRHGNTTVVVKALPVFSKDSANRKLVGAEVNHNVTLTQYIYCSPNCTSFTWTFNSTNTTSVPLQQSALSPSRVHLDVYGVDVEENGYKLSYNVRSFQQKDVGLYTVTACNSVGCSGSFVNLTGSGPPVTPEHFRAVNSTTYSVTLSWKPQYAGGDYIQEFHVVYKKYNIPDEWLKKIFPDSGEDIMLGVVKGLTANTEYVFKIMSVTDRKTGNNKSPYSSEITYQTTKDIEINIPPTSASIGVGAGVGIGIGITVVIVAAAVVVFIILRRYRGRSSQKRSTTEVENTSDDHNVGTTERGASHLSDYSQLQYNDNQNTYEQITHPYQNTGFEVTSPDEDADTDKEGQGYETIEDHTYVNDS